MISRPVTLFSFRYQPPTARCRIHIFQDHFLRIPSIHDTITDTAPHHPSRRPTFYSIHQVAVPRRPSIHASTHSPIVAPNASCRLSLLRPVAAQRIDKENAAKVKRSSCQQHRQGKVLDGTVPCCTATLQRNPQDGNPLPGVSSTSTRKSITTNNGGIKFQVRSITSAHRNLGPGPLPHRLAWPPSFLTLTSSTSQLAPVNKPPPSSQPGHQSPAMPRPFILCSWQTLEPTDNFFQDQHSHCVSRLCLCACTRSRQPASQP
ncbi:hypothetical protein CPAR01_07040 [Colletotrichum paranaense]|uniref:Uncharacterized protein n=1 Tax=Colletotrichum paranaense TaxID=1914294 RepID=A0ABQ9SNG6_9PEZI|nr:uncharacterized protein CPAR01_07040 [Colletotrichum paranaense]KAK1541051.1 hypothetical protein CPAR01_07040 [Colletotrichum paranaense]